MEREITVEELRLIAERAGLKLSEDELRRLIPGISRARLQAAELRELFRSSDEPALTFDPRAILRK
jgi:hypothetical protein